MNMRLGPFIGHTTSTATKIWLKGFEGEDCYIALIDSLGKPFSPKRISFSAANLYSGLASFEGLTPDSRYAYRLYKDAYCTEDYPLDGLKFDDLFFWTMPQDFNWDSYRYDFLLLSCNNPGVFGAKRGTEGYEVWSTLPKIISSHEAGRSQNRVQFVLMGGDQVYADAWRKQLLASATQEEKIKVYFEVYEKYWSDLRYRRVLASLPAYLMWDDHDIMDGWGSETESFVRDSNLNVTTEFKPEWHTMFLSAKKIFQLYQASRNAEPLIKTAAGSPESFDMGFRVGPVGFVMADLRSNRNWRKRVFWTVEQVAAFKAWVDANRKEIEVLFFLTPVVIAHGSPAIEDGLVKNWDLVIKFFKVAKESQQRITHRAINLFIRIAPWLLAILFLTGYTFIAFGPLWLKALATILPALSILGFFRWARRITRDQIAREYELLRTDEAEKTILGKILYIVGVFIPEKFIYTFEESAGDLSDDIRDSWAGEGNGGSTEELLQYLFDLQNDTDDETKVQVVVLSGDIHAGGCSNIYSGDNRHAKRPVIPHIVSSPVGYSPFPWIAEAIYRKFSIGAIPIGESGKFYFQSSHHFTERNVVICSVRKFDKDTLTLKTKFYVEGFPEPLTQVFDLERNSKREEVIWSKGEDDSPKLNAQR